MPPAMAGETSAVAKAMADRPAATKGRLATAVAFEVSRTLVGGSALPLARTNERFEDGTVLRVTVRQTFGMELHAQQKRQQAGGLRLQFHGLHDAVGGAG